MKTEKNSGLENHGLEFQLEEMAKSLREAVARAEQAEKTLTRAEREAAEFNRLYVRESEERERLEAEVGQLKEQLVEARQALAECQGKLAEFGDPMVFEP